ncbi:MAG TPA: LPS export ABC transporter periplasmic protein LptC, partial [Candidatus Omnitrophota bacterium]|nr:LPS export ABC transporter periplasmic protein LptC [Candidatus Omnitrophota bacterium]
YSRFVGAMKIILPSLAVVLLGLVVAWPRLVSDDDRFHIGFAKISPDQVQTLSMVNARYFGVDERNNPFTVTADAATEEDPKAGIIVLQTPKADFTTKSGANVYLQAEQGFYHQKQQLLELVGDVSLFHDQGYELHTEEAEIDLAKGNAVGTKPVDGHGPQGKLVGQGFKISDNGKQVLVTGRSSLILKGPGGKK